MRITYFGTLTAVMLAHFIVPVILLLWIWHSKNKCRLSWYLKITISTLYFTLIYFVGYWHEVSYYGRFVTIAVYLAALLRSYLKTRSLPFYRGFIYVDWMCAAAGIVISVILAYNLFSVFSSFTYDVTPVNLSFPLKNGTYLVCFGGNGKYSPFANYHYKYPPFARAALDTSVIYAMDIVELNEYGRSGRGFLSSDPGDYEIYGDTVNSPCDGRVKEVEDNWPSEQPFSYDYPYNPGNSIIIEYKNVLILLGHLERGSISVKPGDIVKKGQPIARAGNSGWTAEPHLHIQATRAAPGPGDREQSVPILFDGRFPVKNSLFRMAP